MMKITGGISHCALISLSTSLRGYSALEELSVSRNSGDARVDPRNARVNANRVVLRAAKLQQVVRLLSKAGRLLDTLLTYLATATATVSAAGAAIISRLDNTCLSFRSYRLARYSTLYNALRFP